MVSKKVISENTISKRKATIEAKRNRKEGKASINKGIKDTTSFKDDKNLLKTSLKLLNSTKLKLKRKHYQ